MQKFIFVCVFLSVALSLVTCDRSFTVDYENDCFLKDGKPFRYVSGSIHYFRVPSQLWKDRLQKMKMAGLNAIQTYVEWSHHEPEPGVYNFEGNYDLVNFLDIAASLDMLVILRTGPFIDAERDMGGLPYWLLRINPDMKLRTYDPTYIKNVDRWYSVLLPMIRPLLYSNGGPIIMTQVENEYGSTQICDAQYTSHLRDTFKKYLKDEVLLFTTDGSATQPLTCGRVDQVFATMDFGAGVNVTDLYQMFRWHQSTGPLVNSEFYPGWLDHWGQPHANVAADTVAKTLSDILSANASVNIYMFHGGTSFGFSAGSNLGPNFQACPTSYDYDAPLDEAGDPTPKYYILRQTIGQFLPLPPGPVPQPAPKLNFGPLQMQPGPSIFKFASNALTYTGIYPLPFEDLSQPYGFVIYETVIRNLTTDPALLTVPNLADRGYVYVNSVFQGILSREQSIYSLPIKVQKGDKIQILVENQGRVCFGQGLSDRKGIFKNVTLGKQQLQNWLMTPIPMDSETVISIRNHISFGNQGNVPMWYTSVPFTIPENKLLDTYVKLDGWHKGVAFINGFNLGRYWPIVGPQVTLYLPSVLLNKAPDTNTLTVLELEQSPCSTPAQCIIQLVDEPIINSTTPIMSDYGGLPKFYGRKYLRDQY